MNHGAVLCLVPGKDCLPHGVGHQQFHKDA